MPDQTLPLKDLNQQIAQRESELERLRGEYEARQARLAELARQRDELQAQLRQVRAEIQAVSEGASQGAAAPAKAAPPPPPKPKPSAKEAARPKLADVLVEVAREAGKPMTAKELGQELVRRKFPTTSSSITNLVQNRLTELVKRGVFRRAPGQPGVVLGKQADGAKPPASTPVPARTAPPAKAAARTTKPGYRRGQPPLRAVLAELLKKARKPLAARAPAEQVLATGYQTKSQDFTDVVWTALGQLDNVENVKGQGWRLKKG